MKKTLVALAVLAASGASFAQVTMTGEFTWGYKAVGNAYTAKVPAVVATGAAAVPASFGGDSSGFGVDYSNINFAATEDLGGGTKVDVSMGIDGADRSQDGGSAVTGVDGKMTVSGGFGKLMLATMRNYDYLSEGVAAAAGAVWVDFDGYIYDKHTNSDRIEYSYALGPVSLGYQHLEPSDSIGNVNGGKAGLGEGVGSTGNIGQRRNLIQATYTAGALVANAGFGVYDNKTDNSSTSNDSIARISASYDLGVAKIGAGYVNTKKVRGSVNDTYLAIGVPVGALDLGLDWGTRKTDTDGLFPTADGVAGGVDGTQTAVGVGAAYHLSKRTQIVANYVSYDAAVSASSKTTVTKLYLDHSF